MFSEDVFEEGKRDLIMRMCRLGSYKDLNMAKTEAINQLLDFVGDEDIRYAVEQALHYNSRSQAV